MINQYYIWGAGGLGRRAVKRFPPGVIKGIIDSDKAKWGERIGEFSVIPYDKEAVGNCGVIVGFFNSSDVEKTLRADGIPFFRLSQFYTEWYWGACGQNALSFVDLPVTSRCTLNCKYCMQYLPLRYNRGDIAKEEIIAWWNSLLRKFPKIMEVSIMGGEPFLHPKLGEIIEHIANSSDVSIVITTNGMVMPSIDAINSLKRYGVFVSISDYGKTLPQISTKIDSFERKLKRNDIQTERKTHLWIDQGKFDFEFAETMNDCARTHFQLANNKLVYCTLQCAGNKVGLCSAQETIDYVDLSAEHTPLELYKFSSNDCGTTVCPSCGSRIRKSVSVAEQVQGGF